MKEFKAVGIASSDAITTHFPVIWPGTVFSDREFGATVQIQKECHAIQSDREPLYGGKDSPCIRYLMDVEPEIRKAIHPRAKILTGHLNRSLNQEELKTLYHEALSFHMSNSIQVTDHFRGNLLAEECHEDAITSRPYSIEELEREAYLTSSSIAKLYKIPLGKIKMALSRWRNKNWNKVIINEGEFCKKGKFLYPFTFIKILLSGKTFSKSRKN